MTEGAPRQLRVSTDRKTLKAVFGNGSTYELPAEMLRVLSPSAEVQGHSPDQRKLVAGKRKVEIANIEPVGNYAIRIMFSDGHNTGIYTWAYLRETGAAMSVKMADYEAELAEKGLSRDA